MASTRRRRERGDLVALRGGGASPVRVLVADDHPLFAQALMITLATDERMEVVGCTTNGAEAVELGRVLQPDVVLMDVRMPVMNGIAATRRLGVVSPRSRVLMVTAADDPALVASAFAAGAVSYLTKDVSALALLDAVLEAAAQPVLQASGT